MPSLQSKNCFAPMLIHENPESNSSYSPEPGNDSSAIHPIPDSPPLHPKCIHKWEQQLPKHYVLAATPSKRPSNLDVAIQTTDTGEVHAVSALLDSGATGLFIDPKFMQQNCLATQLPNLCADDNSADDNDGADIPLKDGNHILVTSIPPEEEFICASSTTSQRLAEAFLKNTKPKTFCNSVLTHLHDFEDVFTKSSFDALPNCKP